jgi:hypothetical protein
MSKVLNRDKEAAYLLVLVKSIHDILNEDERCSSKNARNQCFTYSFWHFYLQFSHLCLLLQSFDPSTISEMSDNIQRKSNLKEI